MEGIISAIGANIGALHIILFAVGIICLVVEMFEPGFGVFGIAGIIMMIVDVVILAESLAEAALLLFGVALIVLFFVLVFFILASHGMLPKRLVLEDAVSDGSLNAIETEVSVGEVGEAVTRLAPSGKIRIGSRTVDVISNGEFIEPKTRVKVCEVSGNRVVVCRDR